MKFYCLCFPLGLSIIASLFSVRSQVPTSSIYLLICSISLNGTSLSVMWTISYLGHCWITLVCVKWVTPCPPQPSGLLIHTCLQWQRSTPSALVVQLPKFLYFSHYIALYSFSFFVFLTIMENGNIFSSTDKSNKIVTTNTIISLWTWWYQKRHNVWKCAKNIPLMWSYLFMSSKDFLLPNKVSKINLRLLRM